MAKFIVNIEDAIPSDGKVRVTIDVEGIDPKNENRAVLLANTGKAILADGKIDFMEIFSLVGLVGQLGKL